MVDKENLLKCSRFQHVYGRPPAAIELWCANLFLFPRHVEFCASLQKCIFYSIFMAGIVLVSWTVGIQVWRVCEKCKCVRFRTMLKAVALHLIGKWLRQEVKPQRYGAREQNWRRDEQIETTRRKSKSHKRKIVNQTDLTVLGFRPVNDDNGNGFLSVICNSDHWAKITNNKKRRESKNNLPTFSHLPPFGHYRNKYLASTLSKTRDEQKYTGRRHREHRFGRN